MFEPVLLHRVHTVGTGLKQNPVPPGPYDFDVVTGDTGATTNPPQETREKEAEDIEMAV